MEYCQKTSMSTVAENDGQSNKVTDTMKSVALDVLRCEAEIDVTKLTLQKLIADVKSMSQETEEDMLDKKWAFDSDGNCVLTSPDEEARKMCAQVKDNPTVLPDVLNLLHKKLNKLRKEAGQLQQQLQSG